MRLTLRYPDTVFLLSTTCSTFRPLKKSFLVVDTARVNLMYRYYLKYVNCIDMFESFLFQFYLEGKSNIFKMYTS